MSSISGDKETYQKLPRAIGPEYFLGFFFVSEKIGTFQQFNDVCYYSAILNSLFLNT